MLNRLVGSNARTGFTLMELMVVVGIIGILTLIAVPNYIKYRRRAYNVSAQNSGTVARSAQERYYNNSTPNFTYANRLNDLLTSDSHVGDDADVTFTFLGGSGSGYTYVTSHFRGDNSYRFIMQE